MTEKMKTTAPLSSVGADGAQPQLKNHSEIIANETAQINLQAVQTVLKGKNISACFRMESFLKKRVINILRLFH